MKYYIALLYLCLLGVFVSQAQEPIQVFFEKAPNNKIRFFYDKDYFLVDKNCEFRFIERVADFDLPSNKLHGDFKDFDPLGSILLSGTYSNGNKNGEFFAYYPNGTLKWQSSFINNVPHGKTIFYYPDGKPMLELRHDNKITYVDNYWDKTGVQSVKNGEGKIDIILPIMGYTEHGYTKYNIIGNITKGLQNGLWKTAFLTEGKRVKSIPFLTETYSNGTLLKRKINSSFEDILIDLNTLNYFPLEPFTNAEFLQSKNCTFDEHTGFNNFIAKNFQAF